MIISQNQLNIFKRAFRDATDGEISLPKKIDFEKTTYLEFYTNGMRGGKSATFLFRTNENSEPFLELFTSSEFFTYHKIIDKNGRVISLTNYERAIGKVYFSDVIKNLNKDGQSINTEPLETSPTNNDRLLADKDTKHNSRINYWSGFKNLFK